ncbi:MAG: CoA ester lyase [Candidatus Competibacteraceae bacterium]|jgi:citrate lyase subunit beta/citryl-CoA lyase|nr:CoA ester lyase [Candidatus Competibacteraceae bacterium]
MQLRPRRSVLYMPGANARALDKARSLAADGLILDMEDAVSPDAKELAREQIVAALTQGGYGHREIIVRVNGLETAWGHDDVAAVAKIGASAILFPKVESPEQIHAAVEALDQAGAPTDLPIMIMAETPRGILNINAITGASPRLAAIVMGTSDLAKELRIRHTPDRIGFLTSLSLCVLAARAHNVDILDGVYLDLKNDEGFRAACEQGRDMGFDGKTLIHPNQLAVANEVFAPAEKDIDTAREMIAAWEQARAEGKGVAVVNGKLVENLHVDEARRTLAVAESIQALTD